MSKITAEHLARSAYVYIRQSTADQIVHNRESQRRQHGLADRARRLGWASASRCRMRDAFSEMYVAELPPLPT